MLFDTLLTMYLQTGVIFKLGGNGNEMLKSKIYNHGKKIFNQQHFTALPLSSLLKCLILF